MKKPENADLTHVNNPHDKLFRETWSDLENVRCFLQQYLPGAISELMDFQTLEIKKDSFVEKDLAEYFSDMLYQVNLADTSGYVYVLFEHKSYHEKHIHLQLLEYMVKIWRLCIKQDKKAPLPVIIPLLLCHGRSPWPQEKIRFSTMLEGPVEALSDYIPDFSYALYDLTRFSDDEIKGTVMGRVVMLLFKHIFEPDLMEKLPQILSLMRELMEKETGMQYLETVLRYLFNTVDGVSTETIKEIVEQAFSKKEGGFTMTLAERLRMEGKNEGKIEGKIEGLRQAIELGMTLKFPDKAYAVTSRVEKINDIKILEKIKDTIKTAKDHSEITALLN